MSKRFRHTCVMFSTLEVWPWSSVNLTIEGYFQRISWLSLNPWELKSSLSCLLHNKDDTCDPVLTEFKHKPVFEFQNFIHWSPTPPPEASKLLWNGHQDKAFTAEVWSEKRWTLRFDWRLHILIRLSLPPLASCWPDVDHFSPQTSWWWPLYVSMIGDLILTSLLMIKLSMLPVVSMWLFQSSDPTLPPCPSCNVLSWLNNNISLKILKSIEKKWIHNMFVTGWFVEMEASQSWTLELLKPTAMCLPSGAHLTLVTGPLSSSVDKSSEVDPCEASHR